MFWRLWGAPKASVFTPAGRIPALYIAALGTLKHVSVFCPLFAAFGPEPIYQRLSRGGATVLVTTERCIGRKSPGSGRACRTQHAAGGCRYRPDAGSGRSPNGLQPPARL